MTPTGEGGATLGRVATLSSAEPSDAAPAHSRAISSELARSLAEVKGQSQFLLYLVEQIEDALGQLSSEGDPGHAAFLCRILAMYSGQLETKHQGLGERIAETCQELYVTVREFDPI
jgi:hypothetical protein